MREDKSIPRYDVTQDVPHASQLMPLISFKHVSFTYATQQNSQADMARATARTKSTADVSAAHLPQQQVCALKDINTSIYEGEFVGIIGSTGAGKTTLASLMTGAIPHHFAGTLSGSVTIYSKESKTLSLTQIARYIGSVIQDIDAQMVASNVEDELLFGLENFGIAHDEIYSRMDEALRAVGILDLKYRDIDTLSGGQKQKVAIAAILALRPRVMILDEPTCALDPVSSEMIFSILCDLNATYGITIVVIEQKVALLCRYCRRLLVLSQGELCLDAPIDEALRQRELLDSVGINYPRTTRLIQTLRARGLNDSSTSHQRMPVSVADTVGVLDDMLSSVPSQSFVHDMHQPLSDDIIARMHTSSSQPTCISQQEQDRSKTLAFEHVSFSYVGAQETLSDISFSLYPGELVALVGQNGAGKTTITKLTNGLLRPRTGTISLCGTSTQNMPVSTRARFVSTLFQNPDYQLSKPSVREEVAFSCLLVGIEKDKAYARADKVIDELNLDPSASPFMLSRGQRQMVALAATMVTRPRLLLLDEPTCGLDFVECQRVMEHVVRLQQTGCAVLMVCHDMEVVADYATRLMVISEGKLLATGDMQSIFSQESLCSQAAISPSQLASVAHGLVNKSWTVCTNCYTQELLLEACALKHNRTQGV